MDPNETLEQLHAAIADARQPELRFETGETWENIATDLADAADALVGWLDRGGFLPTAWQAARAEAEARKELPTS